MKNLRPSLLGLLCLVNLLVGCSKTNSGSLVDNALNSQLQGQSQGSINAAAQPIRSLEQMTAELQSSGDDKRQAFGLAPCKPGAVRYGQYCMYLGEAGQSCNEVCYYRGGYNRATEYFSGYQGASHCVWALYYIAAFGNNTFTWPASIQDFGNKTGMGCTLNKMGYGSYLTYENFPVTAAAKGAAYAGYNNRRVCSCNL